MIHADEAGNKAAAEIATVSRATHIVQLPLGKDMNEFYRLTSRPAADDWLKSQLEHQ